MAAPIATYYTVYDWMIGELGLKGGVERDTYALLYSLANKQGNCKVGLRYMAGRTGYSERGIRKAISSLKDMGLVSTERELHHGANLYKIYEPASIIGRFFKEEISEEQSSAVLTRTEEQSSAEQRNKVPVTEEQSSGDTPYIYFDINSYNYFFIADGASAQKEKEDLLKEFFYVYGIYQPIEELLRFWDYHEQTGWVNARGQKIVKKKSAARYWTFQTGVRRQSDLAKEIINRLSVVIPEEKKIILIADLENLYREEDKLIMVVRSARIPELLETDENIVREFSKILFDVCGKGVSLEYKKL